MKKLLFLCLTLLFISTQSLYAETKRYEIASGMVSYNITGTGNIMAIKNEIHGHKPFILKTTVMWKCRR